MCNFFPVPIVTAIRWSSKLTQQYFDRPRAHLPRRNMDLKMIKTITLYLPSRISTIAQINNPMNCSRKIRIVKMQRAPMAFCANGRGMLYDPDEAILDDAGELNDVDVELMVLVRSSVSVPAAR